MGKIEIKYKDKTKTFTNETMANLFLGAYNPEMEHRMVKSELYYRFNRHEFWDDDTKMTGEEWAKVANLLLLNC